jgi:hypothetical protein
MLRGIEATSVIRLAKPLYILFDNKPEFEGTAKRIFNQVNQLTNTNDPEGLFFGDFGFASRTNAVILQAADLLTYENTRHLIEEQHRGIAMEMYRVVKMLNRKQTLMMPRLETTKALQEFITFVKLFESRLAP